MSTRSLAASVLVLTLMGCAGVMQSGQTGTSKPQALGTPVGAAEIARWDISIPPSGAGLPAGGGTARQGQQVYEQKCMACHGAKGAGKPADALAGGAGTLASKTPVRTVGSYWPYATTLFDYVRRAMPITNPLSLSNDEVYAVSAYILSLNSIIPEDAILDAQTLPQIKMPNREGFVSDWPRRSEGTRVH